MTRRILPHAPASLIGSTVLAEGEIVHDETANQLRVGDGATPGGRRIPTSHQIGWAIEDFQDGLNDGDDATLAFEKAFAELGNKSSLFLRPGYTYIIEDAQTLTFNDFVLASREGWATIKAANGQNFEYLIDTSSVAIENLKIRGIVIDANKAGRAAGQTVRFCGINVSRSVDATLDMMVKNTLGLAPLSAVAVTASGTCQRLKAFLRFKDLGDTATNKPSDGIFARGDYLLIGGIAKNVTDNAFVLEGCNYSGIVGVTAQDCTSVASITHDTTGDRIGNFMADITASINYVGSTGGPVAIAAFGAGNLLNTAVSNVKLYIASGALGGGPGMQVYKTSTGRVIGLDVAGFQVDRGGSTGRLAQAMLIQSSDDVTVRGISAKLETSGGTTGIKVEGDSVNCNIEGGSIIGGTNGIVGDGTAEVRISGVRLKGQGSYGIVADSASVVTEDGSRITGAGIAAVHKASGSAQLRTKFWQSWTPVYSSSAGNAAATYTATPTTSLASVSRDGNTATVQINMSATLLAVTPSYLEFTLPAEVNPVGTALWTPISVLNGGTFETGLARPINGSATVRIYRANLANFSSGATVEIRGSIDIECVN